VRRSRGGRPWGAAARAPAGPAPHSRPRRPPRASAQPPPPWVSPTGLDFSRLEASRYIARADKAPSKHAGFDVSRCAAALDALLAPGGGGGGERGEERTADTEALVVLNVRRLGGGRFGGQPLGECHVPAPHLAQAPMQQLNPGPNAPPRLPTPHAPTPATPDPLQAMLADIWRWRRRGGFGASDEGAPPHVQALQALQGLDAGEWAREEEDGNRVSSSLLDSLPISNDEKREMSSAVQS
jgi:hypothetical protein